jgi:glycosyltransferase involved in cell wall biosynthesis
MQELKSASNSSTRSRLTGRHLKLLIVLTKAEHGGAQTQVRELVAGFTNAAMVQNFSLSVTVAAGGGCSTSLLADVSKLGAKIVSLENMRNRLDPISPWRALRELYEVTAECDPDIIHVHSGMAGALGRIISVMLSKPCVYTVHGFAFKPEVPFLNKSVAWIAEKALLRYTSQYIFVSEHEARLARAVLKPSHQATVIHNGLHDEARFVAKGNSADVIMVARAAPPKRQDIVIDAWKRLERADTTLWLAGDGPHLAKLKESSSTVSGIRFLGDVNDIESRLAHAGIFVLLSDHEGLPISVIEAMRAGLGIVCTRLPGTEELLQDGVEGILVPNHPEPVAHALARLMGNPALRRAMGLAARKRFLRQFHVDVMTRKTLRVYESMLSMTHPIPPA